jgi:transposase
MADYYVGLDVHSRQSVFVVQDRNGRVHASGRVPTTPEGIATLVAGTALPPDTPVALETGTLAFFVARELQRLGWAPVVIDAHEVRLKAHRPQQKSDRRDAYELADGLRRDIYRSRVYIPPPAIAALRETLARRRHFVRLQTLASNAAKHVVRASGQAAVARARLNTARGWTRLATALSAHPSPHAAVARHAALWHCAAAQVQELEDLLAAQRTAFAPALARLETIPGVGPIVSTTLLAALADAPRFPSAKHAASYAGLVPATYQSGDRAAHGRITKRGSAELRAMACEAAHHARHPAHPLHAVFVRHCVRHGYRRAIIAVAHKLVRIAFAMLRDGTAFDPARRQRAA